jgi:hypothetical protein
MEKAKEPLSKRLHRPNTEKDAWRLHSSKPPAKPSSLVHTSLSSHQHCNTGSASHMMSYLSHCLKCHLAMRMAFKNYLKFHFICVFFGLDHLNKVIFYCSLLSFTVLQLFLKNYSTRQFESSQITRTYLRHLWISHRIKEWRVVTPTVNSTCYWSQVEL